MIFNGSYKPDSDEILIIEDFLLNESIFDAIKNPLGIKKFAPEINDIKRIRALFMGRQKKENGNFIIAFQKFRKEQYLSKMGINLFHDKDTFTTEKRFGFSINPNVDCIYEGRSLKFSSFYFARQVFDLTEYYREATNKDIENFTNHKSILIEDAKVFNENADNLVRRKLAIILDSGFLEKHSATKIKEKAKGLGITVLTYRNKLKFPNDRKELKQLLKFLDDEIYKGVFSEEILQTNSKRKAEI